MCRFGAVVMVLHDMSDPLMEIAKLCLYSGQQGRANFWFASFAVTFIASRCYVYPKYIIFTI
jgi:hypothetical protein